MEKVIEGFENYKIVIDDQVRCINVHTNKELKNVTQGNRVIWNLRRDGKPMPMDAERLMEQTFPDLPRKEWLFKLYKDVRSNSSKTRTVEIIPGVKLTSLYSPVTYYLETPLEMNPEREIRKMFPGPVFNIEEGNEVKRWREIYFRADMCLMCVAEKLKDFFNIP